MKKTIVIIIAIVLTISFASMVRADYFNSELVKVWNSRKDLQKVFPGDPYNNKKLDSWCQNYGWKEYTSLFNCYPDKAIVEKIIDEKYQYRITELEKKINQLTNRLDDMSLVSFNPVAGPIINTVVQNPEGSWRNCRINSSNSGESFDLIYCDKNPNDSKIYVDGNPTGWSSIKLWIE